MIQSIKRYLAIRSYVRRLSNDLARRFGKRRYYTIHQVSLGVQRGKFSVEFVFYAHAVFCQLEDFEKFYPDAELSKSYGKLRQVISRRYLSREFDFDADTIIRRYRMPDYIQSGDMEPSDNDGGGGDGHH
jgi:hypothetical protein